MGECQSRNNLKVRALSPNNWTKVAHFVPRTLNNQSGAGPAPSITFDNKWLSTNNLDVTQFGYRGLFTNDAPVFDTQENIMSVDIRVTATVHMRGPKNASSTIGTPLSLTCDNPAIESDS